MLKKLIEQRNSLLEKVNNFKDIANERAITDDENNELDSVLSDIKVLDNRIKILELEECALIENELEKLPVSDELRSFLINPNLEFRSFGTGAGNVFKQSEQGAVVPTTLSDKIIEKVLQESEILPKVTRYSVTGELIIPKFDRSTLSAAFFDEFVEVVESNAQFTSIRLTSHRVSALIKISKKLINNVSFDIESYLINQLALTFRDFLEKSLIQGASGKFDSLFTATAERTVVGVKKDGYTIDGLIDLQIKIPTVYQGRAVFIMHKELLSTLRKLKDTTGQYYVLPDVTRGFGFQILGTSILTSDFAPKNKIFYGDLSCYVLTSASEMNINVLREKYATQYAVGAVIDAEFGGKIVDDQGIAIFDGTAINS